MRVASVQGYVQPNRFSAMPRARTHARTHLSSAYSNVHGLAYRDATNERRLTLDVAKRPISAADSFPHRRPELY